MIQKGHFLCNAFSGIKFCLFLTQGVALGWYVTPFQGLKFCLFLTRGVALGWYITPFQGLKFESLYLIYRFSHKDFGKAPDQNYPQAYNSTLRTNFYLGTKSKIFMTKSVTIIKTLPINIFYKDYAPMELKNFYV